MRYFVKSTDVIFGTQFYMLYGEAVRANSECFPLEGDYRSVTPGCYRGLCPCVCVHVCLCSCVRSSTVCMCWCLCWCTCVCSWGMTYMCVSHDFVDVFFMLWVHVRIFLWMCTCATWDVHFVVRFCVLAPLSETTFLTKQPDCIKFGTMRHYQLEGLNWMIRLNENGINGEPSEYRQLQY